MKKYFFEDIPPSPADAAAEAKRKAAEKAALDAEKAANEAEKKRYEGIRNELEKKRLEAAARQAGISSPTVSSAAKAGGEWLSRGVNDPTNRLAGMALGGLYGLARAGLGRAAGLGVAATKAAGRGIGKIAAATPSVAKKAYQGAVSGAGKTVAAGIAATKAAGRAVGLSSSYDYSELVRSLSRLDEQQYQQLLQQIDADQIELVESAMRVVGMGPGYNRLRTRLVYKFDEAVADPQTLDDLQDKLEPKLSQRKHLRPWYQNKPVGPFGPKGPEGKRITLRSHRTGTTPKETPVPTVESAPVNAVGSGENIAGINPPAGPALLGSSKLKGVAAGSTAKQIAKRHGVPVSSIIKQLEMGAKVEREHTQDAATAQKIAMDHVYEDPKYYSKLARMEGGKTTKQENYDIGNNTRFTKGDRFKKFRITMMQTRRPTNAHPGNPGIEYA